MLLFFFCFAAASLRLVSSAVAFAFGYSNDVPKRVIPMKCWRGRGLPLTSATQRFCTVRFATSTLLALVVQGAMSHNVLSAPGDVPVIKEYTIRDYRGGPIVYYPTLTEAANAGVFAPAAT
jgi:hypothetical protein